MISDILLRIAGFIIAIISAVFSSITYVMPTQINDGFVTLAGYAGRWASIFPVDQIFLAIGSLLSLWAFLYTLRLFIWMIRFIPGNKHIEPPVSDTAIAQHRHFEKILKGKGVSTKTQ